MFRTARIQRFRAVFPKRVQEKVVAKLHEAGVVQFKEVSNLDVARMTIGEEVYELSSLLAKFREIQDFLGPSQKVVEVREFTCAQTIHRAKKLLNMIEPRFNSLKEEEKELENKKQELTAQIEVLKKLVEIDSPLSYLQSTDEVRTLVGWIAGERVQEFLNEVNNVLNQKVFVAFLGKGKRRIFITVCLAREQQKLLPVLYRFGVELMEIPLISGTPREAAEKLERQLGGLANKRAGLEGKRKKLAKTNAAGVSAALEMLNFQIERLRCAKLFGSTEATVVIEGWVPKKKADLDSVLVTATDGLHIVRVYEPQKDEAEVVPSQFENPKMVDDFEIITETFGMPKYDEVDPTPFIAFTFPLFFAFCLSDAAYGLLLGIFMASGLRISKVFPQRLKRILILASVFTVVIGALIGGWFGISPLWVNSMEDPIPILKLAVFIGIIHIVVGYGTSVAKDIFRRDWRNAVLNHIPQILVVMGFFGMIFCVLGIGLLEFGINFVFPKMKLFDVFNPSVAATSMVIVFRVLFYSGLSVGVLGAAIMAKGLRGRISGPINVVYGLTSLIADAASYSRLMALSIATSIIAYAINYIGIWIYGSLSPTLSAISGLLVIPLVAILGFGLFVAHCFNVFIQSLGAFIHTMRLHYVEFFGKFYEGEGKKFSPFKAKRRFTKVRRR